MSIELTILGAGSSAGTPVIGCECSTCKSNNPKNKRTRCSSLVTLGNGKNILIETDSPYLAPVPNRGKMNEPSNVVYVAEKIAELHNCSVDKVAEQTSKNFFDLFHRCQLN